MEDAAPRVEQQTEQKIPSLRRDGEEESGWEGRVDIE
jgi:hypothetical protein